MPADLTQALSDTAKVTPFRLGLLVDSLEQPAWVHWSLQRIFAQRLACPALVIVNAGRGDPQQESALGPFARLRRKGRRAAYGLYSRVDRWRFPVADDPLRRADLTPLVERVPKLAVTPRATTYSDYFSDEDVDRILESKLDLALRLGFRILRGRALGIARLGVWSYHHGDNRVNRGGPPGFWEVVEAHPTTGAVLQVLSESLDNGRVLARTWAHTEPYSVSRNRARLYWHAAPLLERALRDANEAGALVDNHADDARLAAYSERLYVAPSNADMLRVGGRLLRRATRRVVDKYLRDEQWCLAYRRAPNEGVPDLSPYRFRTIIPPNDRFWADPFPARHEGRDWIFFEELIARTGRGRISVLEIGPQGIVGEPVTVLEPSHHLSYPFVFRHDDAWYLMPESREKRRIDVYRATSFPFEWTLDRTMLEGVDAIDPTLAYIGNRWWLFANVAEEHRSSWIELHAFYGDSPFGPWTPHRRNPIVADVRRARPAGKLFQLQETWYRPSQDCSLGYGAAINIQRIDRLDPDGYAESSLSRIEPRWRPNLVGTHTINAGEDLTVMDVRRGRWRWQR